MFPRRIVCLTEETTEWLYQLGQQDRIVGISGFTVRPPEARRDKPKVSAFLSAKTSKILELRPDLVLGFSNLQADIARELIREGLNVLVFNQRSVEEIFDMLATVARIAGCERQGEWEIARLRAGLTAIAESAQSFPRRPRVFFEEWSDPLISGIRWVDELVEIAGGEPILPHLRDCHDAKDRILDPAVIPPLDPEVILASWCGRKVNPRTITSRAGWEAVTAVREGWIREIKSSLILQPGPAALTDGAGRIHHYLRSWAIAHER